MQTKIDKMQRLFNVSVPGIYSNHRILHRNLWTKSNRISDGAQTAPRRFCFQNAIPFHGTPVNVMEFENVHEVFRYDGLHENRE